MNKVLSIALLSLLLVPSVFAANFKAIKEKVEFQGFKFVRYESEHFVIFCEDKQEKKYSANLEKVWQITEAFVPQINASVKSPEGSSSSRKLFAFFFKSKANYSKFGKWYVSTLKKGGVDANRIARTELLWDKTKSSALQFKNKELEALNVEGSIGFATYPPNIFYGKYTPMVSHTTSKYIHYKSNVTVPFWLSVAYSYYLEISLCKRSGTTYLDLSQMSDSGLDPADIRASKAFAQGRSWASIIKKMLRDRKFKAPNIEDLSIVAVDTLTPARAGFLYGLNHFLIHHKFEKGNFSDFLKRVYAGEDPKGLLLEVYGYEKIEDFEKDWYKYMKSSKFK